MNKYSDLSEETLKCYLSKIRTIAKMEDNDAIDELNEFICNLYGDSENDSNFHNDTELTYHKMTLFKRRVASINNELITYQNKIENKVCNLYDATNLRNAFKNLLVLRDLLSVNTADTDSDLNNELITIENEINRISDNVEELAYLSYINGKLKSEFLNASSIKSVINMIYKIEAFICDKNIQTEEWSNSLNSIKEKCACYRALKKLSEAEVAKCGSNYKKYDKLTGEAEVMLRQDWSSIFSDKLVPSIAEIQKQGTSKGV